MGISSCQTRSKHNFGVLVISVSLHTCHKLVKNSILVICFFRKACKDLQEPTRFQYLVSWLSVGGSEGFEAHRVKRNKGQPKHAVVHSANYGLQSGGQALFCI